TQTVFFFQAEDGIRDKLVTGVQTCALPILNVDVARRELNLAVAELMGRAGRPAPAPPKSKHAMKKEKTRDGRHGRAGAPGHGARSEERRVGMERWVRVTIVYDKTR